ncbi:Homocysteine S-methyltransferase [Gymnopilus junonius]|uniref:Homocysteine S-methyltransferase n=1 Tax=Gymnopilus junonius TaxID=109634 RepID=A0A9P5NU08_GYMJU|nr:Homocysteine S-methyltransferase [Gymnopilus junonius]
MQTKFDAVLKDSRLALMDGGLGTTLEDVLTLNISQSPLWSTQPVVSNGEAIVQAHLLFLRAGARIISTSTYQCSMETLKAAGMQPTQAQAIMLKAVHLAKEAKARFQEETKERSRSISEKVFIALSLGPFGATLKPTQEFRGIYPPPYGPRKFTSEGMDINSFGLDEAAEHQAIDALSEFHFNRLSVFASDTETWNSIDFLAFETIPLRREVLAIRRAVTDLYSEIRKNQGEGFLKPWWISCVFPDGESPEKSYPGGEKIEIEDLLIAAFREAPKSKSNHLQLMPSGFGINCTNTKYIRALITKMMLFFKQALVSHPWIVVYPNGNETYDEASRVWVSRGEVAGNQQGWAEEVAVVVKEMEEERSQGQSVGGIIVGGCCKVGPGDIAVLWRKLLYIHIGSEKNDKAHGHPTGEIMIILHD